MYKDLPEDDFTYKDFFVPLSTAKVITFLFIIGIVVYANSLFNGFVLDDGLQVIQNSLAHSVLNIPKIFLNSTFALGGDQTQGMYYKPLMISFYSLIYSFFGESALFFHLFQVFVHIANSILAFLLFKHFFDKRISFILSLIFLVHPINAETVLYISSLQDILFLNFGMLSLLVVFKADNLTLRKLFLIGLFLSLSLLSKETGILFAPVLLLYALLYNRQQLNKYVLVVSLVVMSYIALRFAAVGVRFIKSTTFPMTRLSLLERLIQIPKIIEYYLSIFFFPKDLVVVQNWVIMSADFKDFYSPLMVVLGFLTLLVIGIKTLAYRNKKHLYTVLFFGGWLICGFLMHVQIIPLDNTVADRWFYFPVIGLLGIFGVFISAIIATHKKLKTIFFAFLGIVIVLLATRTFVRTFDWRDNFTLLSHDIKLQQDNFTLEYGYGYELISRGRLDEAINHLEKANQLFPDRGSTFSALGVAYSHKWDKDRKEETYKKSELYLLESIKKEKFLVRYKYLANLNFYGSDFAKAKDVIDEALKYYPQDPYMWFHLSRVEYYLGNKPAAVEAIKTSLALEPTEEKKKMYYFYLQGNDQPDIQKPR